MRLLSLYILRSSALHRNTCHHAISRRASHSCSQMRNYFVCFLSFTMANLNLVEQVQFEIKLAGSKFEFRSDLKIRLASTKSVVGTVTVPLLRWKNSNEIHINTQARLSWKSPVHEFQWISTDYYLSVSLTNGSVTEHVCLKCCSWMHLKHAG